MSEVSNLPISSIREGQVALRPAQKTSEQYAQLVESIKAQGVVTAITVNKIQDETGETVYELIDGCQRLNAAKDAGLSEIPVNVIVNASKLDVLKAQLSSNFHRVDTKPVEYSNQLKAILNLQPLLTAGELAASMGVSVTFINNRLSLQKLAPEIAKLADEGTIKTVNAIALARLPVDEQKSLVDLAVTQDVGTFAVTVGDRLKQLKEAAKAGGKAPPIGFVLQPRLRKLGEFEALAAKGYADVVELVNKSGDTSVTGIIKATIEYATMTDPVTYASRKADYDALQEKKAADAATRAAKRDADKKAKEQAEAAAAADAVA